MLVCVCLCLCLSLSLCVSRCLSVCVFVPLSLSLCGVYSGPLQDAIKKTSKDELPDFYNIQLERPKDDDKGYDVLFIDAASKVSALLRALPCLSARPPVCLLYHALQLNTMQCSLSVG